MSTESRPKSFFDYRLHLVLPGGQTLAVFKKDYIKGMFFQRYWDILDAQDNPIGKAQEDSIFWGLVRRYVPYGDFMLTNFNFFLGDRQIGTFNRKFTIADKYVLDLSMDPSRSLDRRVAVALGVLLDTGEHR
jgi:hypothetical protein